LELSRLITRKKLEQLKDRIAVRDRASSGGGDSDNSTVGSSAASSSTELTGNSTSNSTVSNIDSTVASSNSTVSSSSLVASLQDPKDSDLFCKFEKFVKSCEGGWCNIPDDMYLEPSIGCTDKPKMIYIDGLLGVSLHPGYYKNTIYHHQKVLGCGGAKARSSNNICTNGGGGLLVSKKKFRQWFSASSAP